ncbi:MAG TPA: hypothetical protein VNT76_23120, partial [Candidatus Binatus sp.]|nr:hypothetical protein [Candidatus Binatus sp.]
AATLDVLPGLPRAIVNIATSCVVADTLELIVGIQHRSLRRATHYCEQSKHRKADFPHKNGPQKRSTKNFR